MAGKAIEEEKILRTHISWLQYHGSYLGKQVLAETLEKKDLDLARACLQHISSTTFSHIVDSHESTTASGLKQALRRLISDIENRQKRDDLRRSAEKLLQCVDDAVESLPGIGPRKFHPMVDDANVSDKSAARRRSRSPSNAESDEAPVAKKVKAGEVAEPKAPVFVSAEEEEKFMGRTFLEEIRSNIKKLLRVQEDAKKYETYLEALQQVLHKMDHSPLMESLKKQTLLMEWAEQARKVVEAEEKNNHLLPHLLAQLDGWVVMKDLHGDAPKPAAPPITVSYPTPLPQFPQFWPNMMPPALPGFNPFMPPSAGYFPPMPQYPYMPNSYGSPHTVPPVPMPLPSPTAFMQTMQMVPPGQAQTMPSFQPPPTPPNLATSMVSSGYPASSMPSSYGTYYPPMYGPR